jgi:hypothetical protein
MTSPATIDLDRIKADKSVKKEVLETYTYLKIYMDQKPRKDWLARRKIAWDAIENDFGMDKEKNEMSNVGQDFLPINKCNKGVQGSSAIVTDQKPEMKFLPIGSSDLYVAELMKRAHDLVWTKNDGADIVYDVVEEAKIGAIGFIGCYHDPSKGMFGRIVIHDEPPEDIYWDKDSRMRDMSDTHIIKAKMRTKSYILENYDGIDEKGLHFEQRIKGDTGVSTGLTGKDNYTVEDNQTPETAGATWQEPENIWEIEAWMLKKERKYFVVTDGQKTEYDEKRVAEVVARAGGGEYLSMSIEKRYQRIIVGKQLMEENINPYGEDADGDPVLNIIALPHWRTRTSYPMSPTNYAVPLNKEKIKRRAQFIYSASQNINSPIVQPAGKYKWQGTAGTPGSTVDVDNNAAFQIYRLQPGSIDIHKFVELEQLADAGIDDQYDLHDVMRGKIPEGSGNIAGRTVIALQDLGGMMSKPFLRKLEAALIRLGKIDMALILRHWPREMWERLLEDDEKPPDGTPEAMAGDDEDPDEIQEMAAAKFQDALEKIRPKDPTQPPGLSLIDLDVKVTAGSSMPTHRMAKEQVAIEKVAAGIYDAEAALEYADDPLKDKVIARLKKQQAINFNQAAEQPKQ